MAPRRLHPAGAALACGLLLAVAAPGLELVGDGDPHPADRDLVHRGLPVPCDDPRATITLAAGDSLAYADTTSGDGVVPSYACQNWDETGPEHVYLLELADELVVDVYLGGNDPDLDLILLSACDSDSCLIQVNTGFSGTLSPGSYVLVVDGYHGAAGAYDLALEARAPGIPPEVCTGDTAQDLGTLTGDESLVPITGTLFGQPNLVSVYDCSPIAVRGGERWYEVTLAAADTTYDDDTDIGSVQLEVTATPNLNAATLDLALWLFDGCGPDAVCLAYVDEGIPGEPETLAFRNTWTIPVTIYLAVDCLTPPGSAAADTFVLSPDVTVPVRSRSLSDLKGLFR